MPRATDTPLTDAQRALVEANLRLAYRVALRYQARWGLPRGDDCRQVAILGLCRAAQIFDPARGVKFSTLAFHCCRNALREWSTRESRSRRRAESWGDIPDGALAREDAEPDWLAGEQLEVVRAACNHQQRVLLTHLSEVDGDVAACARRYRTTRERIYRKLDGVRRSYQRRWRGQQGG